MNQGKYMQEEKKKGATLIPIRSLYPSPRKRSIESWKIASKPYHLMRFFLFLYEF